MTTIYQIFCIKNEYFYFFSSKKLMKIYSKAHHLKKFSRGIMPPNPPSKCLATPRVANSFAACNSPSPTKVAPPPMTNHTYSHGLRLRNLFEEIRS